MIRTHRVEAGRCRVEDRPALIDAASAWIDLVNPTREEELEVERLIGAELPTPEEMAEIEVSSRVYMEGEAAVMTLPVLIASKDYPEIANLTFVLTPRHLATIRYAEPSSFTAFAASAQRQPDLCSGPVDVFAGLSDAVADRIADLLEEAAAQLDRLGRNVFAAETPDRDLRRMMQDLGRSGEIASKSRETLVGLSRVIAFARGVDHIRAAPHAAQKLKVVARDVDLLIEHADATANRITFLLDAMLGMINIEQNAIIKIFSVVAVMFLPPTLIASVYGMNFHVMPELDWTFGYPLAICAMVASMIAPYLYFRRKGWI